MFTNPLLCNTLCSADSVPLLQSILFADMFHSSSQDEFWWGRYVGGQTDSCLNRHTEGVLSYDY